jgi:alpha-tubulin suppressor-like RCC1 family protein
MKNSLCCLAGLLLLLAVPGIAWPRTLHVPADYSTIQAALTAGVSGDTVIVAPGIYHESVNFGGKGILLVSSAGPAATWLEAVDLTAVYFDNGESSNAILSGFTITNAAQAIAIVNSSPVISSNVLVNCGSGIDVSSGSPVIANNQIIGCGYQPYFYYGAMIYLSGACNAAIESNLIQSNNGSGITISVANGTLLIANNFIQGNQQDAIQGASISYFDTPNYYSANIIQNVIADNGGYAADFSIGAGCRGPVMVNNTLANNGGGGVLLNGYIEACEVVNNIIFGRYAVTTYDYFGSGSALFQNNDLYPVNGPLYYGDATNLVGFDGNISANPFLTCTPGDDFHLLTNSPCIGAGTTTAPYLPTTDFAGLARNPARVDLGAYAFNAAVSVAPCVYLNPPIAIIELTVPGQFSTNVVYPAIDATPGATVTCVPPSGSLFAGGTNTVNCTAVYGASTLQGSFQVIVEVPPTITNAPSLTTVVAGVNATLSVGAYSSEAIAYQWNLGGNPIPGATNSTLVISNAQSWNEGYYTVKLSNDFGSTNSPLNYLRVVPVRPQITSQSGSITVPAGGTAEFDASATGSQPLFGQWLMNGAPLWYETTSPLVISNVQASDAGSYQFAASNYLGLAVSTGATLVVLPAKPTFIVQPASIDVNPGDTVNLTSLATGSDDFTNPLTYFWYFQTNALGPLGHNLWLGPISTNNQGDYFVVASNLYGSATSDVAHVLLNPPIALTQTLTNIVTDEGNTAVFTAAATGTSSVGYSWSFNYLPLTNTSATLTLSNVTPAESGFYSVTASNLAGSLSSTGRLSVYPPRYRLVVWGDNTGGQTNVPVPFSNVVAVAGGDYFTLALQHDGTVAGWGLDDPAAPTNALRYVAIAAGSGHALGILEDGSLATWGRDDAGQADNPYQISDVLAVAAGDAHSVALTADGRVLAWGDNTYGQASLPWSLQGVSYFTNYPYYTWVTIYPNPALAIAAHGDHSLALLTNGTVTAWGENTFGESTVPATLSNAVAIAAGYFHSVALGADGTVTAWGDDTFGQTDVPAGLSNVVAIAAGDFHTLALTANGRIVAWGDDTYGQLMLPTGLTGVAGIGSGAYHGIALVPATKLTQRIAPGGKVILNWGGGILQWSPTPGGPYSDLPSQGAVYTNSSVTATPARFFRVRY